MSWLKVSANWMPNQLHVSAVPPEPLQPLPEEHLKTAPWITPTAEGWIVGQAAESLCSRCHPVHNNRPSFSAKLLRSPPHLYVSAAGHFAEILLLLQSFVDLIVRHAEAAQPSLDGVVSLCEDDELGHIWHADDLAIHLRGEVDRFLGLPTVYQPESAEGVRWRRRSEAGKG